MEFERPKKIFLVDDDEMLSAALTDFLTRKAAHKISVFHTGEECLKHLDENPEVIILDFYLNTVQKDAATGLEILQAIRKNYPKIPVIMLSSQEKYSLAVKTIQHGAIQYVIKDDDAFVKIAKMVNEI